MTYSVRYQVFVSSTYTDLKEERAEVLQAIWELDCIPTGMEAFVAANESQWEVIKRVINECDYYVLIIGGRYGSVTEDGISYTEKEFRYAQDLGIPVLAFVHANPEEIAVGKSEKDDKLREKLESFRAEVMNKFPVRTWTGAVELGGLVSRSLTREIKVNPRPGWIRNDGSSPIALLEQVNKLSEENRALREAATVADEEIDATLEHGADEIEIHGTRHVTKLEDRSTWRQPWSTSVSWDDLFRDIGPVLINEATEPALQEILARFHVLDPVGEEFANPRSVGIDPESWNEILVQFRALGLLDQGIKRRGVNDRSSYWRITSKGDRHLISLLARRKGQQAETPAAPSDAESAK
jgi:hypothetical protein